MSDSVDRDLRGTTELRIHGVSGTPPDQMLEHPQPVLVAGNEVSGFYRRLWPSGDIAAQEHPVRREAYSWAGLTSGSGTRALWLLLLPFMLVNVGHYMLPSRAVRPRTRKIGEAAQRLFALTMTVSMVVAFVVVFVDLLGWQCARSPDGCLRKHAYLRFLAGRPFDEPGLRLTLTALVPLVIVLLLWRLGHQTWARYESVKMPASAAWNDPGAGTADELPLESREIWNGQAPVARMRSVHVSAGLSVIACLVLAALIRDTHMSHGWGLTARILLFVQLAALALDALIVLLPSTAKREKPTLEDSAVSNAYRVAPWLALGLLFASLLTASLGHHRLNVPLDPTHPSALAWMHGAIVGTFTVQAVLLLVIAATMWLIGRAAHSAAPATPPGDLPPDRAMAGLGGAVLPFFGWMLAGGFAAGFTIRLGDYLGRPVRLGGKPAYRPGTDALVIPPAYYLAAVGFAVLLVLTVALLAPWAMLRLKANRAAAKAELASAYPDVATASTTAGSTADDARAKHIVGTWAVVALTDSAGQALTIVTAVSAFVCVVGAVWFGLAHAGPPGTLSWLTTLGTWLIGAFALGLVAVGRLAYKRPKLRRSVGIIWDVGSFWPRATHPLAPPCYTERALPDLTLRLEGLTSGERDRVILSAHSQGTVIAAATVLQMDPEVRAKMALLTYGCPLRRLYGRFFPAYFGPDAMTKVGAALTGPNTPRAQWPWRNLHRPSDPIGGAVFRRYGLGQKTNDVDQPVVDPQFQFEAGNPVYPKTYGHSDYWTDPTFQDALRRVIELRT